MSSQETREDPISKSPFTPKSNMHYFENQDSIDRFIEGKDPMKKFEIKKREINWPKIEKVDPKTGERFMTSHPARKYKK